MTSEQFILLSRVKLGTPLTFDTLYMRGLGSATSTLLLLKIRLICSCMEMESGRGSSQEGKITEMESAPTRVPLPVS